MTSRYLTPLFFLVLVIHIAGRLLNIPYLDVLTKPLLLPLLFLPLISDSLNRWLLATLIAYWVGDILMMGDTEICFIASMLAFLIGHILFLVHFSRNPYVPNWFMRIALLTFSFVFYFTLLYSHLPAALRIPIGIYVAIISFLCIGTIQQDYQPNKAGLALGAALFLISDALIAFDRYVEPIPLQALFIMGTYGVGQYLLATLGRVSAGVDIPKK